MRIPSATSRNKRFAGLHALLALAIALLPPGPVPSWAGSEGGAKAGAERAPDPAPDLEANLGVEPRSGELIYRREDLAALGPAPSLAFRRSWRSRAALRGALGGGWTHCWEERIQKLADGGFVWWNGDGEAIALVREGEVWRSREGDPVSLKEAPGLLTIVDRGQVRRIFQEDTGRLLAMEHPNGRRVSLSYAEGLLAFVQDETGRNVEFIYVAGGSSAADVTGGASPPPSSPPASKPATVPGGRRLAEVRGPGGWALTIGHSEDGLMSSCGGAEASESFGYDALGYLKAIGFKDRAGEREGVRIAWDSAARVASLEGPSVRARRYDYLMDDDGARSTRVSYSDEVSATFRYQPDGRELITSPMGDTVELERDARGSVRSVRVPGSGLFRMEYDARQRLVAASNPLGHKLALAWDDQDRLVLLRDARGKSWRFEYDERFNLARTVRPDGTEVRMEWDAIGRLLALVDPAGGTWRYRYDPRGNLASATDPAGVETRYVHDELGRLLECQSPSGARLRYEYTASGHLAAVGEGERRIAFEYDASGGLAAVVSARGERVEMRRDSPAGGSIGSIRDGLGRSAVLRYDELGRLLSATDAGGRAHRFDYDLLGRVTSMSDPAGGQRELGYNAQGLVARAEERDGSVMDFDYDALGRLSGVKTAEGQALSIAYDAMGNPLRVARGDGAIAFDYDDLGRPAVQRDEALGVELRREYDKAGRMTALGTPWGQVRYEYDAAGRPVSVVPPEGGAIRLHRGKDGLLESVEYPNGQSTRFERDPAGRVASAFTTISAGETQTIITMDYDLRGFPSEAERDGERRVFRYDDAGRLLADGRGTRLRRGPAGRVIEESKGLDKIALEYDAAGRPVRRGDETYAWDARGRMIRREGSDGAVELGWDASDRLTSATLADGSRVQWTYDAMGRKASRTAGSETVRYVNLDDDRIATLDAQGKATALYVFIPGTDEPLAVIRPGAGREGVLYLHGGAQGDVVAVSDAGGKIVRRQDFDAFGRPLAAKPDELIPFGYRGRVWEPTVGLWDMRARHLDPALGVFLSEDPLGLPGAGDLYGYAAGNPNVLHDPTGAVPVPLITGAVGAAVGAATYALPRWLGAQPEAGQPWDWGEFGARVAGGFVAGAAGPFLAGALGSPAAFVAGHYVQAGLGWFAATAGANVAGGFTEDLILYAVGQGRPGDWAAGSRRGGSAFRSPAETFVGAGLAGVIGAVLGQAFPGSGDALNQALAASGSLVFGRSGRSANFVSQSASGLETMTLFEQERSLRAALEAAARDPAARAGLQAQLDRVIRELTQPRTGTSGETTEMPGTPANTGSR